MSQLAIAALGQRDDALATPLLVWALDRLGPEVLSWHPATVRHEWRVAAGADLSDVNFDRLMAAIAVLTTDLFFTKPESFASLTGALCGQGMVFDTFHKPEPEDCAWAITEALLLAPPDEQDPEPFSLEVRGFLGHLLRDDGYLAAPEVLGIATGMAGTAAVLARHADDPELAARIHDNQAARDRHIRSVIHAGLLALAAQLESLELEHGDAKQVAARIYKSIHTATQA